MHRKIVSPLMRFTFLWLVLAVCSGSVFGGDLAYRPVSGGLQMSLTTNGFQFEVGNQLTPIKVKNGRRVAANKPSNLVASVVLANRGSMAVPFTFADAAAAERKFRFKVFTEDGTQIWESEPAVAEGFTEVEAKLEKRSPWRRTVQVPLSVGGTWLATGRYTLEAAVDAEGGPGATAVFEVINGGGGYIPTPPNTGIVGMVVEVPVATAAETFPTGSVPVRNAQVYVEEIVPPGAQTFRAPFTWFGRTDADGKFRAPTIPGRFKVTASRLFMTTHSEVEASASGLVREGVGVVIIRPPGGGGNSASNSTEVDVPLGQFVDVLLTFKRDLSLFFGSNVHSVNEVNVAFPAPGTLRITANGTVSSGGWSNAQLVQRSNFVLHEVVHFGFRSDLLEFDLVATPPSGPATTVMSPVVASKDISLPAGIREIRVNSQTNSQSVVLP